MSTLDERFVHMFGADGRVAQIEEDLARLKSGGPGGTSGGVTDDWKAGVDRQLGQLHQDMRALLKSGICAVVALAAMVAGLYLYTNTKFDAVSDRLTRIEVQQQKSDGKLDLLLERSKPPAK